MRGRGIGVLIAVVLVLVTTGVFAGLGVRHASHQNSLDDERTSIALLAGKYAVDFTSVDYRHLDSDFQAAAKNATPDFAKKYLSYIKIFEPIYTKGEVVQTTSVELAGVSSLTPSTAVVLVALKGVATNTRTKLGTQQLFRMQISLEKVGEKWLTSNVVPL
jgi:Mce-associated membrane protein